jgi:hypothetical protein
MCFADGALFNDMGIYQTGEFEHVDLFLAVENGLKSSIRFDELLILKLVLFDVFPKLLGQFGPGERMFTNNLGKRSIGLNRFHKCAFRFAFVRHR